jgi:hypothetical protein
MMTLAAGSGHYGPAPDLVEGRVVFSNLAARQDYELTFAVDGYAKAVRRGVVVSAGQVNQILFDFDPDESTGITGVVNDSVGAPQGDVNVAVVSDSTSETAGDATTTPQGHFQVVGLAPGVYRVLIVGDWASSSRVSVTRGRLSSIVLRASR